MPRIIFEGFVISESLAKISSLHPLHGKDILSGRIKNTLILGGSNQTALKRPSKQSDLSRPYIAGDPIHMIDWKAYARSDKLLVREERDSATKNVKIICDLSSSMAWPRRTDGPSGHLLPSKLELAYRLAFHLAFSHRRCGDYVEILLCDLEREIPLIYLLKPRRATLILDLFQRLCDEKFETSAHLGNFTTMPQVPQNQADQTYLISDALNSDRLFKMAFQDKRVCYLHTLSSLETDFSWLTKSACYIDQKDSPQEFDGKDLMKIQRFSDEVDEWRMKIKNSVLMQRGLYLELNDQTSLRTYLNYLPKIIKNKA